MKKGKAICNPETCYLIKNTLKEWHPAILQNQKTFRVKKGDVIFKEGDEVKGVFFVNSGNVKVHIKWDAYKDLIVRFAKTGSIVGHRGIGSQSGYHVSATALENSVICFVDIDFFEATLKVNAAFTYDLLYFFASELRESERKMRNLAHMPVKGRVAEALLALQEQFGISEQGFINIQLSRQDLASFAGATYETVFRVINDLVQDKLISLSGKNITIANKAGLSTLAVLESVN